MMGIPEKRIIVTGGHHTPAIAVIDAFREKSKNLTVSFSFFWLGHKYSMWNDASVSAEFRDVTEAGIPFFELNAGRFYNTLHPLKLIRIPFGFLQAFFYLLRIKPHLVISFGGYLAVPVVIVAWLLRVPVVTHEQTTVAGWGSRLIARFAKIVFISFPTSATLFPKEKVCLIGNPLRSEIFIDKGLFKFDNGLRTLYFSGGKQGSHFINSFAAKNLKRLLASYNVIHQCGSSTVFNDLLELREKSVSLPNDFRRHYLFKDFFDAGEIGSVFARADLVVSRAGANTVYEIGSLGKISVLIPLPWSSYGEQNENALFLSSGGASFVLNENEIDEESFFALTEKIFASFGVFKDRAEKFSRKLPRNAGRLLVERTTQLLHM